MIKNIRHTGIVVKNLEDSLHFYVNLLGFKIEKKLIESGAYIDNMLLLSDAKVTTVKLSAPDQHMVELLYFHSHPEKQNERSLIEIGPTHIALTVDDLDLEYSRLMDEGVPFNAQPQLSPDGFAKVTFCRAPEGTFIELVEVL